MLLQFQGMMAEYERALIMERTRRGKAFRARAGVVNVLGGAPFGYRYIRRSEVSEARYQIIEDEAHIVRQMFRRYAEEQVSIGELARWLTAEDPTRTGKDRWDRLVIWADAQEPRLCGPGRLPSRQGPRIAVRPPTAKPACKDVASPAIKPTTTVPPRSGSPSRFRPSSTRTPSHRRPSSGRQPPLRVKKQQRTQPAHGTGSLLPSCGYAYYRTSTRTAKRKIYYYRCLGSDDYRYQGGRVCDNKPVRADYLDEVVWTHVTALLADPTLVQTELDRRLAELRATNPATAERARLERDPPAPPKPFPGLCRPTKKTCSPWNELRARMPDLRAKQASLQAALDALDAAQIDQETYLKLAESLESFLARLRDNADTTTVEDRQKVLRSVVKEVLVGPERVTIRHSIPVRDHPFLSPGYPLRWGSHFADPRGPVHALRIRYLDGPELSGLSLGALCRRCGRALCEQAAGRSCACRDHGADGRGGTTAPPGQDAHCLLPRMAGAGASTSTPPSPSSGSPFGHEGQGTARTEASSRAFFLRCPPRRSRPRAPNSAACGFIGAPPSRWASWHDG